jgi:hypothetical protein
MDNGDTCTNQRKYGFCRCPLPVNTDPIVINENDTYYPKAGMLRACGTSFMNVRTLASQGWGLHFCRDVLQRKDVDVTQRILSWIDVSEGIHTRKAKILHYIRVIKEDSPICCLPRQNLLSSMHPLHSVCKIQTWIRRTLKTWRQTRRLAFAMGMHARLGRQSAVMCLPADTLRLILDAV